MGLQDQAAIERAALEPRFLGHETPLIGRSSELQRLDDLVEAASRERRAAAAVVLGAPGIGKSRLRFELLRMVGVRTRGTSSLIVRGDPMLADVPLGAIARALRHDARIEQGSHLDAQRAAVRAWVESHGIAVEPALVGELMRVEFDVRESAALAAARNEPAVLGARLRAAFIAVLQTRVARGPLVMAVDDAQWADRATIDLVAAALTALADAPLVVIAFGRPETRQRFATLFAPTRSIEIELQPLGEAGSAALVRSIMGSATGDAVVDSIVRRATGNPLFVEELVRAARPGHESDLPFAIQAALQSRLDALEPGPRRVARVASVLGNAVWREAIAVLAPGTDVDTALRVLVESEVLAERQRSRFGGTREFIYRHALLRDVAYGMLSPDERSELHRTAALWLERAGETDDAVLAQHHELAGDGLHAAERYLAAARREARESAYELALRHGNRALVLGPTEALTSDLHAIAAVACHPLGRYAEGLEHSAEALARTRDIAQTLELAATRGLTLRRMGDVGRTRAELVDALAATQSAEATPAVVHGRIAVRVELAWNVHAASQHAIAIGIAEDLLKSLPEETHGLESLVLSAFHVLGRAQHGAGELERALVSHRVAVDRAEAMGHRWRAEGARYGLGQVLLALGQNDEARSVLTTARDNARALGLPSTEGYALVHLGAALARLGEHSAGLAAELEAGAIGARINAPVLQAAALALRASIALAIDDRDTASAAAREAIELAGAPGAWRATALAVMANVHARNGGGERAREACREADALRSDGGWHGDIEELTLALMLRAFETAGDRVAAEALRRAARARITARLAKVSDPALRAAMLAGVPEYRELLDADEPRADRASTEPPAPRG